MSYQRVIPRDLFNEANLLKCLGRLYLELEKLNLPDVELVHADVAFEVDQDPNSGSLVPLNITLHVRGAEFTFSRPLNSRDPWPLYVRTDEELGVFEQDGALTAEFISLLHGQAEE